MTLSAVLRECNFPNILISSTSINILVTANCFSFVYYRGGSLSEGYTALFNYIVVYIYIYECFYLLRVFRLLGFSIITQPLSVFSKRNLIHLFVMKFSKLPSLTPYFQLIQFLSYFISKTQVRFLKITPKLKISSVLKFYSFQFQTTLKMQKLFPKILNFSIKNNFYC